MAIPAVTVYESDRTVAFACLKHGFQGFALFFGVDSKTNVPLCPVCVQELLQKSCAMTAVAPPKAAPKEPVLKVAEPEPPNDPNPTPPPSV